MPNGAHSVGFCASAALKCAKVVLAQQARGHFVQKLFVQGAFVGPRRIAPKGRLRSLNRVAVAPTLCTKPCMKSVGSRNRLKKYEVVGQKSVEPKHQFFGVNCRTAVQVRHIVCGMNSRIRAAGSHDFDGASHPR